MPGYLKHPKGVLGKPHRDLLRRHGHERNKTLPSDFHIHSRQLLTFHNLNDDNNPFAWAVDLGTIVDLAPREFYDVDQAQERVFKALLRYALQEKLYRECVRWQHKKKLFAFMPLTDEDMERKIKWRDVKQSERHVYERKLNRKDPSKIWNQKHLAFAVDFYQLSERWYVSLTPDWFFSYGQDFRSSRYATDNLSWLKRRENNAIVEKHFRFLVSWLKELDAKDMFTTERHAHPSVTIGDIVCLQGHPALPDEEWLPVRMPEEDGHSGELFADREEGNES